MKSRFSVYLAASIITLSAMPAALAADVSAPLLVHWNQKSSSVDISDSQKTVAVNFIVSDESRISEPRLLVKSVESTQSSSFATMKEITRSGKLVTYEATATINVGQSPGEWVWVLYPLSDEIGNTNNSFGPGPAWPARFIVFDKIYTAGTHGNIESCLYQLRPFNETLRLFYKLQRNDPDSVQLSVIKLEFSLPDNLVDEKLCKTDTWNTLNNFTYNIYRVGELKGKLEAIEAKAPEAKSAAEPKVTQGAASTMKGEIEARVIHARKGWSAWISSFKYVKGANPMVSNKPTTLLIEGFCTSKGKTIQAMKNTSANGVKYSNGMRYVMPKWKCVKGTFSGKIEVTGVTKMSITEEPQSHLGTSISFKVGQKATKSDLAPPRD